MKEKKNDERPVALLDMDGTVADYDYQMGADLGKMRSPIEKKTKYGDYFKDNRDSSYMQARMRAIKAVGSWWENLPKRKLGFDIVRLLRKHDFRIVICTQGPKFVPVAWSHKVSWCMKNLPDVEITITRDKSLQYGRILVDDFTGYIKPWLKHRPRGLVIMPATPENAEFKHPNVIRYDGTNIAAVEERIIYTRNRPNGEL
ncbi:MAG: hypothetical protein WC375_08040 [Methanomassiliicoccales archaeon]|jgi:hypothetical protein